MITYEDFKKLELKIATIKDVQEHPNADKLYVVTIDVGAETKQVVAGIRLAYPDKNVLIGRQVVVVNNLEPVTLRGVESHGMLLAASDEKGISVVSPDRELVVGSTVK